MSQFSRYAAAAIVGTGALSLMGAAAPAQDDIDTAGELESAGYTGVVCVAPEIVGDEVTVPAADSGSEWLLVLLEADVDEETSYQDLAFGITEGDVVTIVNKSGETQTLLGAELCSVAIGSEGQSDIEPNFGIRPYGLAINGDALNRPGLEDSAQNPVVETDVPADPGVSGTALAGTGVVLSAAGALTWFAARRTARR